MGKTKEIIQYVPKGVFMELRRLSTASGVNVMRDEIAKLFVDEAVWNKWYGCALEVDYENDKYLIKHRVSTDFKEEYIRG